MTRMATEEIYDRRRMFELFTALKVDSPCNNHIIIENVRTEFSSQEQGIASSKFLSVNSLLGKDASLASVVDEIIQLWTSTWVSDAEHDNAISENVQNLQRRCTTLIRQIMKELQTLRSGPTLVMGGKKKLGAAPVRDDESLRSVACLSSCVQRLSRIETDFGFWKGTGGAEAADGGNGLQGRYGQVEGRVRAASAHSRGDGAQAAAGCGRGGGLAVEESAGRDGAQGALGCLGGRAEARQGPHGEHGAQSPPGFESGRRQQAEGRAGQGAGHDGEHGSQVGAGQEPGRSQAAAGRDRPPAEAERGHGAEVAARLCTGRCSETQVAP